MNEIYTYVIKNAALNPVLPPRYETGSNPASKMYVSGEFSLSYDSSYTSGTLSYSFGTDPVSSGGFIGGVYGHGSSVLSGGQTTYVLGISFYSQIRQIFDVRFSYTGDIFHPTAATYFDYHQALTNPSFGFTFSGSDLPITGGLASGTGSIDFSDPLIGNSFNIAIGQPQFGFSIKNFGLGDSLKLINSNNTSISFNKQSHLLTLSNGESLYFDGDFTGKSFVIKPDASGIGQSIELFSNPSLPTLPLFMPHVTVSAPLTPNAPTFLLSILDGAPGSSDTITARYQSDAVSYASASRPVVVDLGAQATWDGQRGDTLIGVKNAIGSSFNDIINGSTSNNVLDGGAGADSINGGAGIDTISFASKQESIVLDLANAVNGVIINLAAQETWDGISGDRLSSIENAIGSKYNDVIFGSSENNVIDGNGGADKIYGGAGADTISFASAVRSVIIDLGAQATWDGANGNRLSSIENAIGSAFDDLIYGNAADNVLDGGGGSNSIVGGGGSDTVSYASASTRMIIDLGSQETWDYGTHGDKLTGISNAIGSGFSDLIYGDAKDNIIDGGTGEDTIFGGSGFDTVSFANALGSVVVDLSAQATWDGISGDKIYSIEGIIGSQYNDSLYGDASNNIFDGGGGSNTIRGGGGDDTVTYANSKTSMVINLAAQESWNYGSEGDKLISIDNIVGSRFNDVIYGNSNNNLIDGGDGSDLIFGGDGADTISFANASGPMVIDLGAQATWDFGTTGDTLSSIENAIGSRFNDTISASDYRQVNPTGVLTGGGGNDIFDFHKGFGHQVITDFQATGQGADKIKIEHGLFAGDNPLASAVAFDGGVLLSAGDNDIALMGVQFSDLTSSNFLLA